MAEVVRRDCERRRHRPRKSGVAWRPGRKRHVVRPEDRSERGAERRMTQRRSTQLLALFTARFVELDEVWSDKALVGAFSMRREVLPSRDLASALYCVALAFGRKIVDRQVAHRVVESQFRTGRNCDSSHKVMCPSAIYADSTVWRTRVVDSTGETGVHDKAILCYLACVGMIAGDVAFDPTHHHSISTLIISCCVDAVSTGATRTKLVAATKYWERMSWRSNEMSNFQGRVLSGP